MIEDRSTRVGAAANARTVAGAGDFLYRELSRWVGHDGCHAVFTRVAADARREHPSLAQIHFRTRTHPYIEGATEAVMAHGDPATAAALEAVLVRVIELVGRLIGDDMATNLIERSRESAEYSDRSAFRKQEEA
jgi:hypothetical protein